jgi:hypothetical protein
MVTHYPRERLRYNSERPAAIPDVLVATGPRSYRSADIPLGTPTTSACTGRGLWALYPVGEEVVVAYPGGAVAGPPREVAAALDRLLALDGRDELDRQVVQALRGFLAGDRPEARPGARRWSRPAVGYWLSGPRNQPGRGDRPARHEPGARPFAVPGDGQVRPAPPEATPERALRPVA